MSKNILVAVAWPYASGSRHLGHIGGAYLPADIFDIIEEPYIITFS